MKKRPLTALRKSDRLLLAVDLSNVVHRGQSVHPYLSHNGQYTGGAYGFLVQLTTLINHIQPQGVVICDDAPPYFRDRDFPNYKGNRRPDKQDREARERRKIVSQNKRIARELMDAIGIPVWKITGCEADDLIGVLASANDRRYQLVIRSVDSDLFQLLDYPGVSMYDPKERTYFDLDAFRERYPMFRSARQFIRMTALVGSHNSVPGIKGIGPKTAQKILASQLTWNTMRNGQHAELIARNLRLAKVPYPGIPKSVDLSLPPLALAQRFQPSQLSHAAARYGIQVTSTMVNAFSGLDVGRA